MRRHVPCLSAPAGSAQEIRRLDAGAGRRGALGLGRWACGTGALASPWCLGERKVLEAAPRPGAHGWVSPLAGELHAHSRQTGGWAEQSDHRMPSSPGQGALPTLALHPCGSQLLRQSLRDGHEAAPLMPNTCPCTCRPLKVDTWGTLRPGTHGVSTCSETRTEQMACQPSRAGERVCLSSPLGSCNRAPGTRASPTDLHSSQFWRLPGRDRGAGRLAPLTPGVQTATFLLCPHMAQRHRLSPSLPIRTLIPS